jgi:hypothetical protein
VEIDPSDLPEGTAQELSGAVLRVGGKPIPEGMPFVEMLLDFDLVDELRKRAGTKGVQRSIDETLRASRAGA